MATHVSTAFDEFNRNVVNLDPTRTTSARASRDWLISQLENLPYTVADFPRLYDGMHIKYGSFSRNTKIRPLDDIDLMLTFAADGGTYYEITYGKYYKVYVPQENATLSKLTDDDGKLNSIKVVNKLVNSLGTISSYSKAAINRRQEAATLQLNSYEWNFDIVPAFYTADTGHYLIPDGSGDWKATDPRVDQRNITAINQQHDGKILQIIRTLKYWQKRPTMPTMPSYLFEVMILDYFSKKGSVSMFIDFELRDFFRHLITAVYSSFQDPKGFSGELNNLSIEDRYKISSKASEDFVRAQDAIYFETQDKNQEKSIKKWAEIFGGSFPAYG